MSEALTLWFFRDLSDEQRLKLFGIFGLPVDEIGNVHGRQAIALRHITQKLVAMSIDEAAAEIARLRAERDGLRSKVRAVDLSDQQLAEEMAAMQLSFSNRGEHGGSPGEWSYERMGEIATEQQRRDASRACPACGDTRRLGPYFPGGLSTICGNCTPTEATGGDHG